MEFIDPKKCPRTKDGCEHCDLLARETVVQVLGRNATSDIVARDALTVFHIDFRVSYVDSPEMPQITCLGRQDAAFYTGRKLALRYQQDHPNDFEEHSEDS